MSNKAIYTERTNYKTYLLAVIVLILGVLLLHISNNDYSEKLLWAKSLIRDIGSLLIVSLGLAMIWELYSRRVFLAELLSSSELANEIEKTGIIGVSEKWHGEVDWSQLLKSNDHFSALFMYGRTWRNTNRQYLINFAQRKDTKATFVLPNTKNEQLMNLLATSINVSASELINRIQEAEGEFINIFNSAETKQSKLIIWEIDAFPVYSYYCFENKAIVTFYTLSRDKPEVPTLYINKGGTLFSFFANDFNAAISEESKMCRRVYPIQ